MPLELQIIRAAEFVRVGAQGHFDLAASKAALATLARACRQRGINRALMDLRALRPGPKPVFTRDDLVELVKTFHDIGFTHQQRLAVLYQSDPHQRARLFAFLSTIHGWTVQAFGTFEDALLWLSGGQETDFKRTPASSKKVIPITDWKGEANPSARPDCLSGQQKKGTAGRKNAVAENARRKRLG